MLRTQNYVYCTGESFWHNISVKVLKCLYAKVLKANTDCDLYCGSNYRVLNSMLRCDPSGVIWPFSPLPYKIYMKKTKHMDPKKLEKKSSTPKAPCFSVQTDNV